MNSKKIKKAGHKRNSGRNLKNLSYKLSDEEIKLFLVVLASIMAQVPAPKGARNSYLKEVERRLRNNGSDFLSKSRSFPTYGLKLLGQDWDGFPIQGFKCSTGKKYPKLFAWYWAELERLSYLEAPNKADSVRAQRVLCVLSFAKMIKASSVRQIKKSLEDFEKRVVPVQINIPKEINIDKSSTKPSRKEPNITDKADPLGYQDDYGGSNLLLELWKTYYPSDKTESRKVYSTVNNEAETFFSNCRSKLQSQIGVNVNIDELPQYVDFDSLSTKPSALVDEPALPDWFKGQFQQLLHRQDGTIQAYVPTFGFKPPPYGRVHVLTESAGKLRLIVPYNTPFVHSTGLYARARTVLRALTGDCSENQTRGHSFVQRATSNLNGQTNVSSDLTAFSDNTSDEALDFGFLELNLNGLQDYLFNLPISLPNGKIITPKKTLMGLKGNFEICSMLHHHCVAMSNIKSYTLCGDDLFFKGDLSKYVENLSHYGWSLNRSKTVVSKTAAVFCGEMYWFGFRISPRVPKLHSFFKDGKVRRASMLFSAIRSSIDNLNVIYNSRNVARIIAPLLSLLRKKWKGLILPTYPAKLRGLGLRPTRPTKSLCRLLDNKSIVYMSLMSIGVLRRTTSQTRWFRLPIEINSGGTTNMFPSIPSLQETGAIKLSVPITKPSNKDVSSLDDYQCLEWYYDDTRLEPDQFK
jgi:hypothetical protein